MSLLQIAEKYRYGSDKFDLGYFHAFYLHYLTPRKEQAKSILEIGVQTGDSILLWREFFPNAHVYGIDINSCPILNNQERITHVVTDAYSDSFINMIGDGELDIAIDDGPHTLETMQIFLTKYFPKVKRGGLMVVEDIIDTSWTPILLNMLDKSQCSARVINMAGRVIEEERRIKWANGLDVIVVEKN